MNRSTRIFVVFALLGLAVSGAALVTAQGGDDGQKRSVTRDAPGSPNPESLPSGTPGSTLRQPRLHRGILVFPVGQHPGWIDKPYDGMTVPDFPVERVDVTTFDPQSVDPSGLKIADGRLPNGYRATKGSLETVVKPGGETQTTVARIEYESGDRYPISVARWLPAEYFVGRPYTLAAYPEDAPTSLTLGVIAGREAVFIHRKPGTSSTQLQQVFVTDGDYVVVAESLIDDLGTLRAAIEESLSRIDSGAVK